MISVLAKPRSLRSRTIFSRATPTASSNDVFTFWSRSKRMHWDAVGSVGDQSWTAAHSQKLSGGALREDLAGNEIRSQSLCSYCP